MGQAYTTIQAAIDAAQPADIVTVNPGTYNEAIDFKGKEITVRSKGDRAVTVIDAAGIAKTPVVSFMSGETDKSVLEGFTLMNGTGFPPTPTSSVTQGGGIYIASLINPSPTPATPTTPTIRNCLITKNTAALGGGILLKNVDVGATIEDCEISGNTATNASNAGGGLNIVMSGTKAIGVTIRNTTIKDNLASYSAAAAYGGGAYIAGTKTVAGVTFTNCTISGNVVGSSLTPPITSQGEGGGLYLDTVPVVIRGGEISGNTALDGGGLAIRNLGTSSAIGGEAGNYLVIQNNTAQSDGGALYIPSAATLKFSYTRFMNNTSSSGGGVARVDGGSPSFESCEFIENTANEHGGAFRYNSAGATAKFNACLFSKNKGNLGGAIYVSSSSASPVVYQNCIFTGNTATGDGGAVYCKAPSAAAVTKFFYCTFFRNSAPATSGLVGGIKFDASTSVALVLNSIFWDNIPVDYDASHSLATQIDYCDVGNPVINRSTMFNLDPGFVDPIADPPDLHLMETSQVLGLGKVGTDADLRLIDKDYDGKTRPPIAEAQDLGAFIVVRTPVEKPKFIRGFCRQKGRNLTGAGIDITDPIFLVRWFFSNPGTYVPACQKACDADDNGMIEVTDAVYLLNYLFKSPGPAPKAPFPGVGEDPVPDLLTCEDWKTAWPPSPVR